MKKVTWNDIKEKVYFIQGHNHKRNHKFTYAVDVIEVEKTDIDYKMTAYEILDSDGNCYPEKSNRTVFNLKDGPDDDFTDFEITEFDTVEEMKNVYPEYFI